MPVFGKFNSHVLAGLLITTTFALPAYMMTRKSVTFDEVAHIPAGYSYLRTGEVRLNPMHPPLIKEICALPLLFMGVDVSPDRGALATAPVNFQWEFGRRFLNRDDFESLLFWSRVPAVLLSAGLAILVFAWSRRLWGNGGGLLSLFLYTFDPTITAHAQFVTTDVGVALFSLLFLFTLRGYVLSPSWRRLAACGVTLGLALGSKFSAIFLVPIAAVLLASFARSSSDLTRSLRLRGALVVAGSFLAMTAVAFVVLWAIYLFPRDPLFYLNGIRTLGADHIAGHQFFFMGEFRAGSWPHYFLVAWLVKMPLPTLLIIAAAIVSLVLGIRARLLDEIFLVVPALVLFVAYSSFSSPQGVRYVIPCFPLLFIFAGRLASAAARLPAGRPALYGVLAWLVVEYVAIWPDHLAYFNQIAGGPRGGLRLLDDSNVDWGQGLIQLREYLKEHSIAEPRICAFWHLDPRRYDIAVRPIETRELLSAPPRETIVLSGHCLARAQALLTMAHGDGPGNWLKHREPDAVVGHVYYVYDSPPG